MTTSELYLTVRLRGGSDKFYTYTLPEHMRDPMPIPGDWCIVPVRNTMMSGQIQEVGVSTPSYPCKPVFSLVPSTVEEGEAASPSSTPSDWPLDDEIPF